MKYEGFYCKGMWFTPRLDGERAPQNINKPARARREPHSDQPKLIEIPSNKSILWKSTVSSVNGKSPSNVGCMEKSSINDVCSIAMFDYQRVSWRSDWKANESEPTGQQLDFPVTRTETYRTVFNYVRMLNSCQILALLLSSLKMPRW